MIKAVMKEPEKRWKTPPDLWNKLKSIAREKRHEPTEAEDLLWQYLRKHQLKGLNFRRQHSIGQFIVDFYCKRANLVIEVDGPMHQYQSEKDQVRQEYLEQQGLKVIRFSNEAIVSNIETAVKNIQNCL